MVTEPAPSAGEPGRAQQFVYDATGRRVGHRIAPENEIGSARWRCTAYDNRGRIATQSWPDDDGHWDRVVTYQYGVDNNPLKSRVLSDAQHYDYYYGVTTTVDLLGRTIDYRQSGHVTTTTYDRAGRIVETDGLQGLVQNAYTSSGRLDAVRVDGQLLAETQYDAMTGRLASVTYANGTTGTLSYDAFGLQSGLVFTDTSTGDLITGDRVTHSAAGRVVTQLKHLDGVELTNPNPEGPDAVTYAYDGAGRLVTAHLPEGLATYGYERSPVADGCVNREAGRSSNRTSVTIDPGDGAPSTTRYCYDFADRLTSVHTAAGVDTDYAYDEHGNQTDDGQIGLTWDDFGRVTSTVTGGGRTTRYSYDPLNRVAERHADGVWLDLVYGGHSDVPVATFNGEWGLVIHQFVPLPGGVLLTHGDGRNAWSYPDMQGNYILTTGWSGEPDGDPTVYDPWGQVIGTVDIPDNGDYALERGAFGVAGKMTDLAGIVLMGARPYNPAEGRFLAADPIPGGCANVYVYGFGDPFTESDTTGQICWKNWLSTGLGILSLGLGIAAVLTTGPLAIGLGIGAVATGAAATTIDGIACRQGQSAACGAMFLGGVATVAGFGSVALGLRALRGAAGATSYGATTWRMAADTQSSVYGGTGVLLGGVTAARQESSGRC